MWPPAAAASVSVVLIVVAVGADLLHFLPPPVLLEPPLVDYINYVDSSVDAWHGLPAPAATPPPPSSTTTEFTLPEIIINKSARKPGTVRTKNGHNYARDAYDDDNDSVVVVNSEYLPPALTTPFTTEQPPLPPLHNEVVDQYLPPAPAKKEETGRNMYYYYPRPPSPPPIQFDEPPAPPKPVEPAYLPPLAPPANGYLPPFATRSSAAVAANRSVSDADFFALTNNPKAPVRLELNEMKCLNYGDTGFFKSRITVQSFIESRPVFEDGQSCNRLETLRNQIYLEIPAREFAHCGVSVCGQKNDELCVRIRFPQIRGMRTISDPILVLQCKSQERVVTKTHALRMGIASDRYLSRKNTTWSERDLNLDCEFLILLSSQARSSSTLAQGGGEAKFRTQIGLFRRSGDSFTRSLELNGIVQLGEELMLRMQARPGDGWNFTKVSDITMQRIGGNGEVLNAISLVTTPGCINPAMRSICPVAPVFEPPLGHRFGFKAIMFQGMKSGDEVVMSVRIQGCVHRNDCQPGHCDPNNRVRNRRENLSHNLSEVATISFRVASPEDQQKFRRADESISNSVFAWSCVGIALGFLGLLLLVFMAIIHYRNKRYLFN